MARNKGVKACTVTVKAQPLHSTKTRDYMRRLLLWSL